jgi:STE24 endopeptidase
VIWPRRRRLAGLTLALALAAVAAHAQEEPAPTAGAPRAVEPAPTPFDVAAATRAYLDRVPAADRERSDAYFVGGYWLQLWSALWGLGVAWLLLSRRISSRLRDLAERRSRRPALQTALYVPLTALLGLPLTLYSDYFREHRYGLSNQSFGAWSRDQLVGLAVGVVLASVLVALLYAVIRRAPRTWWAWGAGVFLLFFSFTALIAPVFIAPLFNRYQAVEDPAVAQPILRLARANGIPAERVYQFDASRQSRRISANVSGFGATMRISLNDNLLSRCSQAEIESVMGHEMGHYALNHVYKHLLFFGVVITLGLVFARWGFERVSRCCGEAWGLRGVSDVAGLPLLAALLSVWLFAMTPLLHTWIRSAEAEADLFGINASQQPEGFAEVALKLGEYRKLDPGALEEWLLFDHPSGRSRIEMAMRWRAGHPQSPPRR